MWWILCCFAEIVAYSVKASECTLPSVEDICVYGSDKSFIPDGSTFKHFVYDQTTRANVYFCEECSSLSLSGAYLYVCIDEPTNDYYWAIGSDYESCAAWSSCYAGNTLRLNYLSINSCLNTDNWFTYDGTLMDWYNDIDMRLSICNPICYETDICPQTLTNMQTTKTVERINIKIDKSTTWNGDLYFDFVISDDDCMNPQLSFEYELIDYENNNIQIYDDNDTLIAICNGGQSCGTFDSCLIDYDIDDIIPMNETYSIMMHQTADINNLCGDYILNAVLTLTCITDNITTSIVSETLENQCGKGEDIFTTWFTSTVSSSQSSISSTKATKVKKKNSTWSIIIGIGITIALIGAYCMYKFICHSVNRKLTNLAIKQEQKMKKTNIQQKINQAINQAEAEQKQKIQNRIGTIFTNVGRENLNIVHKQNVAHENIEAEQKQKIQFDFDPLFTNIKHMNDEEQIKAINKYFDDIGFP